ncbi:MAG TPA: hypothetical protein VNT81_22340 [Vicinamibacterales bacterium]|nr:hypothetical protein [Vicinamibacterales bacterium]
MALLLEAGLLLVLIPWSAFWDRNAFMESSATLSSLLRSNYTRGAITGLGLLNVWSALAELGELFGPRSKPDEPPPPANPQSSFPNHQ